MNGVLRAGHFIVGATPEFFAKVAQPRGLGFSDG